VGLQSAAPEDKRCGLALDESLLDDEMAELGMAAFSEAPLFERLAQIFQHAGAAAQHDAIGLDVQRRQADVVEQLLRRDEVGDASPIAERLGSRLNTIFMAAYFVGGAIGTKLGVAAAAYAGWKGLGLLGCTLAAVVAIAQGCASLFQWYKRVK
jgi:hypothetical protein